MSLANDLNAANVAVRALSPALAFHAAFLVAAGRVAVFAQKPPVRAEGDDPLRLHALPSAQDLLHRHRKVVVSQFLENAAEKCEGVLVSFEERLLRRIRVGAVKSIAARHAPHGEEL